MSTLPNVRKSAGLISSQAGRSLRDLVLENPAAAPVFETFSLDYCCGGSQTLAEACQSANLSSEDVIARLEQCDPGIPQKDWRGEPLSDLAQYIVDKHHAFTRSEIARLQDLIAKVISVHGGNHPELSSVRMILESVAEEMRQHMWKEENILFPHIARMEEAARIRRRPPQSPFGTVQNPVAMMIMEHDAAGQAFQKMREITSNYAVPQDGCASYRALYQALPELAADLHQHIHLENNILFPRAIELEGQWS